MNYYIKISNNGEIDTNGLHLMGVTDKREDKEKIGFFGSGNKYSIALLLREKIPFKIFSGTKEIEIATEPVMFRGQLFDQIVIDGQKTSLTTSMGPDWETWFTIREFYCNALDEGGAKITVEKEALPEKGKTAIFIQLTDELSDFFKHINEYLLIKKDPIYTANTSYGVVDFLKRVGDGFICYRKGIRIYPENKEDSLYHYNFDEIDINESRTYKHEYQIKERIASALTVCDDRKIILNFLNNWQDKFEKDLYWDSTYVYEEFSSTWQDVLKGKRVYPESVAITSGDFEGKFNSFIVPDKLARKIADELVDVEVVSMKKDKTHIEVEATKEELAKINRAVAELGQIGYQVTSDIKVMIPSVGDVMASYDKESDTIFLARKFLTTIREIKNTLLEEHFHSKGHSDGQRELVTFLIDELILSKENQK